MQEVRLWPGRDTWVTAQFEVRRWAVENARGLGRHLAQWLAARGEQVDDVPCTATARVRELSRGGRRKNDIGDGPTQPRREQTHGAGANYPGREHHRRPTAQGMVKVVPRRETGRVGALDQLFSRSRREIEAQATALVDNETGRHFITLAAELLGALRLWAQREYRSDQAVRELLEAVDPVTLREIAAELQAANDADATGASQAIRGVAQLPSGHLLAIASYAARAL
jgi:hypothetical protein